MSFSITLETEEIGKFAKALKREGSELSKKLRASMVSSVMDVQTTAKKPGYVPYKTGSLRRSITSSVDISGSGILGTIGSNLDYAAIHEFGGRTGRNGSVYIQPSRYIQRAVEDNEDKIRERIRSAIAINRL